MNWNDIRRIALSKGFVFERHGSKHDIYCNPRTGERIQIERRWSQEVRRGLLNVLRKKLGF